MRRDRRGSRAGSDDGSEEPRLEIRLSAQSPLVPETSRAPSAGIPRSKPRTTRRVPVERGAEGEEREAARPAPKSKNPMLLIGGIVGGVFLLIIIIAAAASSGSPRVVVGGGAPKAPKKAAPEPAYVPPPEAPKASNFIVNTGSIMFVCGGSDQHADKEIVLSKCPGCSATNRFSFDSVADAFKCEACSAGVDKAAIKCDLCGRVARKTHLKKVVLRTGEK
jgi:hypothetical protein